MAYSVDELRQRRHLQFFEARHSGGYFDKIVGLHPLADRVASLEAPIERKSFTHRQDVIEAKSAALGLPKLLYPLDLILTQRRLLNHVVDAVKSEKISVIAATDPLYSGLFGLWVSRRTGVPLVIHVVGNYDLNYEATGTLGMPRMFPSRRLENAVIKYVLRRADLVAAGSETLREYSLAHGATPARTEVFRVGKNMVAEHRVHPTERRPLDSRELARLKIANAPKRLLTVARLETVKMVDDSIRAFSLVVKTHPDAILILAGQGSQREELEGLARQLGVADRVCFLGLIDQDLLARIAPGCIALSPLTGMALFETSMAGCPAIAYDCDSAVNEMIQDGVTGWILPRGDWEGMGRAASDLLNDPDEYRRLSDAIRRNAELLTDERRLYAHEEAAFERLLAS
jgi:glycosyltransferase involved in cell wall biosynthesis